MGFRCLTVGAAATLIALSVSGCSLLDGGRVIDILERDNAVRQQLSAVVDTLDHLPHVGEVDQGYDYAAVTDRAFQLELRVAAERGVDVGSLAEVVREGFARDELETLPND